ncbi:hypothetical protein [Gluconobacter kondonii]|uniref:hypothetical protein n=1 Tax=Gluconobacter kondonii TaxID=941463 RepID=UPI001B8B2CFF|nr:hypothetical protein [Gluconobacter kondonii]MBS1054797.1 hypothetical protein [Gluconobacter kondonii]
MTDNQTRSVSNPIPPQLTVPQLQNEIARLSIRVAALADTTKKAINILRDANSPTNSDLDQYINAFTDIMVGCTHVTGILAGFEDE